MALGGGVFTTQNKKLPGAYINFVSAQKASATLSERGYCALPMELNWGKDKSVITLTNEEFITNTKNILGYDYTSDYCKPLREVFKNAQVVYLYKLNDSVKAENEFCTAKYGGIRGNDIKIVITNNVDKASTYDVKTLVDNVEMDVQKGVVTTSDLKANDFVDFKDGVALKLTASTPLTGGSNGHGTPAVCKYAEALTAGKDSNNLSIAISAGEPLQVSEAKKATNKYGEAVTPGVAGNLLKIKIENGTPYEQTPAAAATCKYADAITPGAAGNSLKIVVSGTSTNWTIKVNNGESDVFTKESYSKDTIEPSELTNEYVTFKAVALSAEEVQLASGADAVMGSTYTVTTLNGDSELDKQENLKTKDELHDNAYVHFTKTAELTVETVGFDGGADAVITQRYDVTTKLNGEPADVQRNLTTASELKDNQWVTFNKDATLEIEEVKLTGGSDTVSGASWQAALNALESYSFNTLGVVSNDEEVKALAAAYTKRLRDDVGVKFQTVVFNYAADEKGVINLVNGLVDAPNDPSLVYWLTGAECACKVYETLTNRTYDGEYEVDTSRTQTQLESCVDNGELVLHQVGTDVRVLTDINSKVTITADEGDDFKSNQTMRVLDQIANDIASTFNDRFLGKVPNDNAGRISFWNEVVKHHQELLRLRAIENFLPEDVTVEKGQDKKSIVVNDNVTPTNSMEKLYMTCVVN